MSDALCIIPARAGSKRIPNKNIRDFFGKPMLAYALEVAAKSGLFAEIHVSTDSPRIREIAEHYGCGKPFARPDELAGDTVGLIPVLRWVLEEYERRGQRFETVTVLLPTCPLIDADDLIAADAVYRQHGGQRPLHVVTPFPVPIEWAYRRDEAGLLTPVQPGAYAIRSQDLPKAFYETGPFSIFARQHLLSDTPATDEGFVSHILSRDKAIDVDDEQDWKLLEAMYALKQQVRRMAAGASAS